MRHTRETVAAMFGSMRAGPKFNQGRSAPCDLTYPRATPARLNELSVLPE